MRHLVLGILAAATALGPMAAAPAFARDHDHEHGDRGNRGWDRGDDNRGGDRNNWRGDNNRWQDNNRPQLADRRWDRRDDRWDRRDDRWDRREDRWDRRGARGDNHWSSRDHWRREAHNGYYYRNAWYFGPPPSRYYNDRYYRPGYRSWERGYRVPSYYRDDVVWDYGDYRLRRPPRGYHWVRADNDFLLVAIASGIIAEVILNGY